MMDRNTLIYALRADSQLAASHREHMAKEIMNDAFKLRCAYNKFIFVLKKMLR